MNSTQPISSPLNLAKLTASQLLQLCKKRGLVGCSGKKKQELIERLQGCCTINEPSNNIQYICEEGPSDDTLRLEIKKHVLSTSVSRDLNLNEISTKLGISENKAKKLYTEIPPVELIDRPLLLEDIKQYINANIVECQRCQCKLRSINTNTVRIWHKLPICDTCWGFYEADRDDIWDSIYNQVNMSCVICNKKQNNKCERFHFDHINMFNKSGSVCTMVNEGVDLDIILKEISQCQVLCLECHHIVTKLESQLGFTRLKSTLTRKYNNGVISEVDYVKKQEEYQTVYKRRMNELYNYLRDNICNLI